jgi:uncharacterized membrane-anchored protein
MLAPFILFLLLPLLALAEEKAKTEDPAKVFREVKWIKGPAKADIGKIAQIDLPKGYIFAGPDDTRRLLEAMQNLTNGSELGLFAPEDFSYFVVFEFDESGYVKDDEKDKLDTNAILQQIKDGTEEANKERKKRGWSTMSVVGWDVPPSYNKESNNLEWAVRFASGEGNVVNFNTRYLGREGVMRITLVVGPDELKQILPRFRTDMAGFSYTAGHRYFEYVEGDKVAKYGLTALIVGGAAAAAAKTGLFKYLGKIIMVAGLAIIAFVKSLVEKVRNLFSRKKDDYRPPPPPVQE